MSNHDIERFKNELLTNKIELSDTISQFMEKCNNNFSAIIEWGGGPAGEKGDEGEPGIPTKPKVPIHIWRKGIEYDSENIDNDTFTICYSVDLTDSKYQEGHLIMLKNAHVYILETNSEFKLTPKYIFTLQSYDPSTTINGENAYMHIAYANSPDGDGFVTDQELRNENVEVEPAMTYNLRRDVNSNNYSTNKIYMGVYSDNDPTPSQNPYSYTWVKIQGDVGAKGADGQKGDKGDPGEQGPKGDKGDGYTGQPYTIDLEGDMSTISIDVDRTRLYDDSNDYCMCKLHAYYGDQNVLLDISNVTVNLPEEFEYYDDNCVDVVLKSNSSSKVGKIEKSQNGKDVIIKFTPDVSFVFPTNPIIFSLHIESEITDDDDESKYNFNRYTVWMVKGIVSSFELEIIPKHRLIKLSEDGTYNPEKLLVDVYKNEDGKRTLFDFNQYESFTLLYKNYNDNDWIEYPNEGVETSDVSCLEFKVVRYLGTSDEETWDYEDVWVVADGKSTHYYHADLGAMESMMVLTTGERINISENPDTQIYCAKLRDESGYSITFEPKLYDGETELTVQSISVGSNSGEEYYTNGSFERKIEEYTLTITKVPYDVEMIPMNIIVSGVDSFGVTKQDTVSFNIYISNLSNIYTLSPTISVYNTSTGTDGVDKIGCNVYKNNILVETDELNTYALTLEYIVCGEQGNTNKKNYTKPIVYGYDISGNNDVFTASDVAIEFILSYRNKEVAMATVPLIKDGQNGKDGENGQDGISTFISTIFKISKGTPNKPVGGTYDNPVADSTDWSESIPERNNTNHTYPLWSSSKQFASDGSLNKNDWTTPIQMSDTFDFEVIYSNYENPNDPTIDNFSKNRNGTINKNWIDSNPHWSDDGNTGSIWMATTKMNNGTWSNWVISKIKGEQGPQGESGKLGKVVYPAGEFVPNKLYISTDTSTPYVISNNKYYVLISDKYDGKIKPEYMPNDWEEFQSFEAIYAKIGIIENGTIGSAVYSGDFMFSQQGVNADGNTSTSFQNFNPEHIYDSESTFKPNICMNFKTGEIYACGGQASFLNNGNLNLGGNININGTITIGGDLNLNGFFKRTKTEITSSNYNNYTTTTNNGLTYLDVKKTGTYIHITSLPSNILQINLPYHKLPYINKSNSAIIIDRDNTEIMRQLYGNEVIIVNDTLTTLCIGCRGAIDGGTVPSGEEYLEKGVMSIFKMTFQETEINNKNIEAYCWVLESPKPTISATNMTNNTNIDMLVPKPEVQS